MNIRYVRDKIKSVVNVRKITKAMQLVSAVKMKKAQQLAVESLPYRRNLEKITDKLIPSLNRKFSRLLTSPGSSRRALVIVVSSNKGLCGAFNFNLFRHLVRNFNFQEVDFITIGKKATILINRMGGKIIADFSTVTPIDSVSALFQNALSLFYEGRYSQVILVYNKFVSTTVYDPTSAVILPVIIEKTSSMVEPKSEYIVEPSAASIVDSLLKSLVEQKIRGAIVESEASEHSARMIAMKNATENAEDVIYNLTLLRNKIRQEKITYELLDMVTAKESVEQT